MVYIFIEDISVNQKSVISKSELIGNLIYTKF